MKRFKFRLQSLLRYREYLERVAQQNTAKAQMNVTNCEKQIFDLIQIWEKNADEMESVINKGVNASTFRQYNDFLDSVQTTIKDEELKKIELNKILREKLLELKKKSVDKKAMELFKKKIKSRYDQEMIKTEQKELDETVIIKTARVKSNETI